MVRRKGRQSNENYLTNEASEIAGLLALRLSQMCLKWHVVLTHAVRGQVVQCRENQMKNVCDMLKLRSVDCRKCSCYVAWCEKRGLQIS